MFIKIIINEISKYCLVLCVICKASCKTQSTRHLFKITTEVRLHLVTDCVICEHIV